MCQDLPAYASPEASVYDAVDYLFDTPGKLRKRGGWTTPSASAISIGRAVNPNLATGGTLYFLNNDDAKIYAIDTSTGTKTFVLSTLDVPNQPAYAGRPAEHLGTCVIPFLKTNKATAGSPNIAYDWVFAGATAGSGVAAHPGSATITAGSAEITLGGGDTTSGFVVGQFLRVTDGSPGTNYYTGVIQSIIGSTSLTVRPTPGVTFTPTSVTSSSGSGAHEGFASLGANFLGGKLVTSFQNRLIFADTLTYESSSIQRHPQRVFYSILPNETPSYLLANNIGAYWAVNAGYENDNFFEIAASTPIMGMTPVGEGQLLFFSATECFRLTGTLSTQTATSSGVNIDVRRVSSSIGCLADRSIAQTQRGVIFGSLDGVYAYDGAQFRPLMNQRIANLWRDYVQNNAAIPIGAAIVRGNHYVVTLAQSDATTIDTLICNLDTLAWGRITNTPITGSVIDPLNPNITWAARVASGAWTSAAANRALIRLDPMFAPASTNRTDGNTTAVAPTLKTRSYAEGDPNTRKKFRRVQVEYDMRGGSPTLAVASDTELKVSDASYTTLVTGAGSSTLGTTSLSTEVTFDTVAKLAKGVAIQHQITQTGGSDTTEILGLKHGFQTQREGRSN
jgi:hypothetical protein